MAQWETSNESLRDDDKRSLEDFCETLYQQRQAREREAKILA